MGVRCPSREAVLTRVLVARSSRVGFRPRVRIRVATVGARVGGEEGPPQRQKRSDPSLESTRPSRFIPPRVQARDGFDGVTLVDWKRDALFSQRQVRSSQGEWAGEAGRSGSWPRSQAASNGRQGRGAAARDRARTSIVLQKSVSRRRARSHQAAEARHRHRV